MSSIGITLLDDDGSMSEGDLPEIEIIGGRCASSSERSRFAAGRCVPERRQRRDRSTDCISDDPSLNVPDDEGDRAKCRIYRGVMTDAKRRYTDDVPDDVIARLRELCRELPDAYEERAWVGVRWMARKRTFAHVLGVEVDDRGPVVVLSFRSAGDELETLRHAGHPFLVLGWGRDALGMVLDVTTDWAEVAELVVESFCVMAPKKLIALVDRPDDDVVRIPDARRS